MGALFNLTNIATGVAVTLICGLVIWGVRWVVNQGPTATNNQRLKDLLDTNERVMAELIEEKEALTDEKLLLNKRITGLERDVLRITAQNGIQQGEINDLKRYLDLIKMLYTQETGKTLPAMTST
jgi:hypothetical protein